LRSIDNSRAGHVGHGIVNQQQIDWSLSLKDLQRQGGIVRFPHRTAIIPQECADKRANVAIIIANEDPCLARAPSRPTRLQREGFGRLAFGAWAGEPIQNRPVASVPQIGPAGTLVGLPHPL